MPSFDPYDFYSPFYDATFGRFLRHRLAHAVRRMGLVPGERVLDIGVGTGITLDFYPRDVAVVGVDRSRGMLKKAEQRIAKHKLAHARVQFADAHHLPFEDNAFDAVFMGHVLSVVDNPRQVIREALRVSRPEATLVIVNHFQLENPLLRRAEEYLSPLFSYLGWRTNLRLPECLNEEGIELIDRVRLRSSDLWEIVLLRNRKGKEEELVERREVSAPSEVGASPV